MPVYNQSGFEILSASIIRRRFREDVEDQYDWDVLGSLIEVSLFESIFEPVMSGNVVLIDTASLASSINFQGQEIFNLQWRVGEKNYNKTFYIWSVSAQDKDRSTQSSSLVLNIIERHGYIDQFKYLNSSSAGNVGQIIASLLDEVDAGLDDVVVSDHNMRIMHNNRNPLDIVRWLAKRATNSIGEPMFCYSTLDKRTSDTTSEEPNIKFRDLSTMMDTNPWTQDQTFIYTVTPAAPDADRFMPEQYRIIGLSIPENDNIFVVAQSGAMRSTYFNIDIFNRSIDYVQHDGRTHFETRTGESRDGVRGTQYDENFDLGDNNYVAEMDSIFVSGINNTGMFSDRFCGYNEEPDYIKHAKRLSRESDLVMIEKQRFTIMTPGFLFGADDVERGVGTCINIAVPKDQPAYNSDINSLDAKRSGKFLIINQRHVMRRVESQYTVTMEIGRPDTEDNVNDPDRVRTSREQRPR